MLDKNCAHCSVFPTDTLKVKEKKKKKKKGQVSLSRRLLGSSLLQPQPERTCRLGCFAEFFLSSDLLQEAGGFFEDASEYDKSLSFQDMNLSRPLLKVVAMATELILF